MNEQTLKALEFYKVIEKLESFASTPLGKEKIRQLRPQSQLSVAKNRLDGTREGCAVLRVREISIEGVHDIRPLLQRIKLGSVLSAGELLNIVQTITASRRLKRSLSTLIEKEKLTLPIISQYINRMNDLKQLDDAIRQIIDDNGDILDEASPELLTIRRMIRQLEQEIREKLEQIVRDSHYQKMLQEPIVTLRHDHYVLPVKQEYRSRFGGIVHDQSASGATVFIEPDAVIAINRQLREWHYKEEREIERLLTKLSEHVAKHHDELAQNVACLQQLDVIFAKASYARHIDGTLPQLNEAGIIRMHKARHPLIAPEDVVPIDVQLGDEFTVLVITGPNTGGKTVTLKTIGLLTLMAMSGLYIPAESGSKIAVFEGVFADIGDEQSIEQNLSTFSGHMKNIISILEHVTENSLILFDELGSGTDPTEGAALAMALLDDVYRRGCRVVATTHYSELKAYAYDRDNVMNASVEFDVNTLRPTYQLLIGVPGRSHAFHIAERLGLPAHIVKQAKQQMTIDERRVEDMIASLEDDRLTAEKARLEAERLKQETAQLKQRLLEEQQRFENEKARLRAEAEREAKAIVQKAKREADAIISQLREYQQEAERVKDHQLIALKTALDRLEPEETNALRAPEVPAVDTHQWDDIKAGDEVFVRTFNQRGHVVDILGNGEVQVQLGIMKMNVPLKDVTPVRTEKREPPSVPMASLHRSSQDIKTELDLRGQTADEAIQETDKYLDAALLAGFHQVSLIHGKGTGALRKAIHQYLKSHRAVKSYRLGGEGEGGSGVTVVRLN